MILKHTQYSWLQYVITSSLCFHLGTLNAKLKNADVGFFDLKERFLSIKTVLRVLSETNICAIDKLKVGMPSKYLMWLNILLSFLFFYRLVSNVMLSSNAAFYWFKRIHLTISHEAANKNQAIRGPILEPKDKFAMTVKEVSFESLVWSQCNFLRL